MLLLQMVYPDGHARFTRVFEVKSNISLTSSMLLEFVRRALGVWRGLVRVGR
jgi:hypothetical protein